MRSLLSLCAALFLLSSCSNEPAFNGHWKVLGYGDTYVSWDISNDTIWQNKNGLYYNRASLNQLEGGGYEIVTNRGVWDVKGDPTSGEFEIVPAPGTSGEPQRVVKGEANPNEDFYSMVSAMPDLPSGSAYETLGPKRLLNRLFVVPTDPATSEDGMSYRMQIGMDWHTGNVGQVGQFVEFMKAQYNGQEVNELVTCLYLDKALPMQLVHKIKNELRASNQFNVAYIVTPGRKGQDEIGLRRNLFMIMPQENDLMLNPDLTKEELFPGGSMRENFYSRLFRDSTAQHIHIDSLNQIWLGEVQLEVNLLKDAIMNIVKAAAEDERRPSFILSAHDDSKYGTYVATMNAYLQGIDELRDEFSIEAFGGQFKEIDERMENGAAAKQHVIKKYPYKLVDVTKEAMFLFK